MKKSILYIIMITILLSIGFLTWKYFLHISLNQLENNVSVASKELSGQFINHLIFALSLGILPVLLLAVKKVVKNKFKNQNLLSLGIIVGCGILMWQFRIFYLNLCTSSLSEIMMDNNIKIRLDFKNLNFETYLLYGFILGTVLSVLIFKRKGKRLKKLTSN